MSDLLVAQQKFAGYLGRLLVRLYDPDFFYNVRVTLGEGYRRDGRGHMYGSLHYLKLAQDLNVFVSGEWLQGPHPAWDSIAAYWKNLDMNLRWGGDFTSKDYNHFSYGWEGKA